MSYQKMIALQSLATVQGIVLKTISDLAKFVLTEKL